MAISADIIRDRRVTSFVSIRDDMINAGGNWVDEEVVVDGNLISSRKPADLPAFCKALMDVLGSGRSSRHVPGEICPQGAPLTAALSFRHE